MDAGTRTNARAACSAAVITPLHSAIAIAAAVLCIGAAPAAAQSPGASVTDQHGWLSGTLGGGSGQGGLAAAIGLWYTRNTLALGLEGSSAGGIFEDEERDATALLAGFTRGTAHHRFVAAAGLAAVHDFQSSCDVLCPPNPIDNWNIALAFSGQAYVNIPVVGIGLETFGAVGSGRSSFIGLGLSVQLGWLGGRR